MLFASSEPIGRLRMPLLLPSAPTILQAMFRSAVSLCSVSLLTACIAADNYEMRAISYNKQNYNARSNLIVLNIVRSAHRLPLQFTETTSTTGIASSSLGFSASLPFVGSGTATPSAMMSGGPSFVSNNLSTQEFYQGYHGPIKAQAIANMLDQGVRAEILIPLVLARVTVVKQDKIVSWDLDFDTIDKFRSSFAFVQQLVRYGIYVQKIGKSDGDKSAEPEFRICFDPTRAATAKPLYDGSSLATTAKREQILLNLSFANQRVIPDAIVKAPTCDAKSGKGDDVKFTLRSLSGVYKFLGDITRLELALNGPSDSIPRLPYGSPPKFVTLFSMKIGIPDAADPTADFHGTNYYVSTDPTGQDASAEVIQILADLQALNSKGVAAPAPGIAILAR